MIDLYPYCRSLLFRLPPECAHKMGLYLGLAFRSKRLLRLFQSPPPNLPVKLFGLSFPNPVGLAAGFDRHGEYIDS